MTPDERDRFAAVVGPARGGRFPGRPRRGGNGLADGAVPGRRCPAISREIRLPVGFFRGFRGRGCSIFDSIGPCTGRVYGGSAWESNTYLDVSQLCPIEHNQVGQGI